MRAKVGRRTSHPARLPPLIDCHEQGLAYAYVAALADPLAYIYSKKILDQDMHWYETTC